MADWGLLGVAIGFGVAVIVVSILILVLARRLGPLRKVREQAVAALCAQRGLLPGPMNLTAEFGLLSTMDLRSLRNPFSTPDGTVAAADLWHSAGKSVELIAVLSFTVAGLNVPRVAVVRRYMVDFAPLWGPHPLELESNDFDKRFAVWAPDRRSAVMLLDPGMMQWLLDCQDVNFEMLGDGVLAFVYRTAALAQQKANASPSDPRRTEPVEYELLFKFWDGFVPRLPQLLRSEYGAAPAATD